MAAVVPSAVVTFAAESSGDSGNFLVSPSVGLMIWTLLAFGVTLYLLAKVAFPRIQEALDKRQKLIEESIEASERSKAEAEQILAEYRERLRRPASRRRRSSTAPARRARRPSASPSTTRARSARTARADPARHRGRDPSRDPRRSATRSPTSRSSPPRRSPARRSPRTTSASWSRTRCASWTSRRCPGATATRPWKRSPRSTRARSSASPRSTESSTRSETSSARSPTPWRGAASSRPSSSRPTSPRGEDRRPAQGRRGPGSRSRTSSSSLIEKHRMPAIHRIRRRYDALVDAEYKLLPVEVTTAVALDQETIDQLGERIGAQTGQRVELTSTVDPTSSAAWCCGWATPSSTPRSGTASTSYVEKSPRRRLARALRSPDTTSCRSSPTRSPQSSRAVSKASTPAAPTSPRWGTVLSVGDGIARIHGLENCMSFELLELPHTSPASP